MGPEKRTRRARIRREVGTDAQPPKKRTRKGAKPVAEPTEPLEPRRRVRRPTGKAEPGPGQASRLFGPQTTNEQG